MIPPEATAPPDALADGTVVAGRYRIDALLGRGGMATVYRAYDQELEREVAIKILAPITPGTDFVRRFRREVSLALRITHPNVVRLFDLGAAENVRYLTMELIEGGSLRARMLASGVFTVGEAAEIARQAALGLGAAHEVGVVHRDFKPENVLLAAGGRVVVADFGVAGEHSLGDVGDGTASAIVGTSAYMSPEQANGAPATPRADLYALGLLLYELLTGEIPLLAPGPVATALRREREVPRPVRTRRADAPEELELLLARLLSSDPAARPAAAAEVAELLSRFAEPLPVHVPPRSPTPAPAPIESRDTRLVTSTPTPVSGVHSSRRGLLLGAAGLTAGALVTGGLWLGLRGRRRALDPHASVLFAVEPRAAALGGDLAFLAPAVPTAAYRALAARLPGRVAGPSDRPPAGAMTVGARLVRHDAGFTATLDPPGVTGEGPTPSRALDAAAAALVASLLPSGPAPIAEDEDRRAAWNAPSLDALFTYRRALAAAGRLRPTEALERARAAERPGFARPFVLEMQAPFDDHAIPGELVARARAAAAGAPAGELALLQASIDLVAADGRRAAALPSDPGHFTDPLDRYIRAWGLANAGRFDEALAHADAIAADPVVGGIGLWLSLRFAVFYLDARQVLKAARALAGGLPEEPGAWIHLARPLVAQEDLEGADIAVARARSLGAGDLEVADVEAQLAVARLDLEKAGTLGRRLLTGGAAQQQLAGQQTLYAVDVLGGDFAGARRRASALGKAFREALDFDSPDDALELGQDAFARGEPEIVDLFLQAVAEVAPKLPDPEYLAAALTRVAAFERAAGRIDDARFEALLAEAMAPLRAAGIDADSRGYEAYARVLVVLSGACDELKRRARGVSARPLLTMALARCDLAAGDPARALARLGPMFEGHGRRNYPTLAVQRELAMGEALARLGRADEARTHLTRVVSLWRDAPDAGEVTSAEKLLAGLR